MCMDKNAIAERVLRSVIGRERKVKQCMVFEDALGKCVTVQYEGVTEKRAAQIEAIRVVKAFRDAEYVGFLLRVFVTDGDGQNVGSLEVDADTKTFDFMEVGNKWRGKALPVDESADLERMTDELSKKSLPKEGVFIQTPKSRRIADVFSRFYAEFKTRNAREMTSHANQTARSDSTSLPVDDEGGVSEDTDAE